MEDTTRSIGSEDRIAADLGFQQGCGGRFSIPRELRGAGRSIVLKKHEAHGQERHCYI